MILAKKLSPNTTLALILFIGGAIGMLASFVLTAEEFIALKNPSYTPSCNINPLFSCVSVSSSPQGKFLGLPNMLFGIPAFAMVMTVGAAIIAGANFKKWFWQLFIIGTSGGFLLVHWFIVQSLYIIGALCIYCMVVWTVTVPISLHTLLFALNQQLINAPKKLKPLIGFLNNNHGLLLASWYFIILLLILQNFWDYFGTLF